MTNFSLGGNTSEARIVRRGGGSNALGFFIFVFFFLLFQVKAISLTLEVFTVENGLLTPTLKFKRPALKTHFKQTFEDLYSTIPE